MPIKRDRDARLSETRTLVTLLRPRLSEFCAHIALQLNISCPNTGHDALAMVRETPEHLDLLGELRIPLIVKLNLLTPIEDACTIAEHDACAALIISNTVPFGQSDVIDWQRLFPKGSPLAQYGGGGLSGSPLFPFMVGWIIKARHIGLTKPIIACGGIDRPSRVEEAWTAGANGISFATVATTRPWRLKSIIATANTLWS
jgi:dihydroorotate dehydrogenase